MARFILSDVGLPHPCIYLYHPRNPILFPVPSTHRAPWKRRPYIQVAKPCRNEDTYPRRMKVLLRLCFLVFQCCYTRVLDGFLLATESTQDDSIWGPAHGSQGNQLGLLNVDHASPSQCVQTLVLSTSAILPRHLPPTCKSLYSQRLLQQSPPSSSLLSGP